MRAEDARRKENIIEFFFWKNAAKPLVEAEGFLRSAELSEWKDSKGRELNTQKKVLAWADGWEIRNGAGRTDSKFLKFWNVLYAWLLAEKDPMAARLLDSRIRGTITEESVTIALPEDLMNWIEGTIAKLPAEDPKRALFAAFIHGKKLSYEPFVL